MPGKVKRLCIHSSTDKYNTHIKGLAGSLLPSLDYNCLFTKGATKVESGLCVHTKKKQFTGWLSCDFLNSSYKTCKRKRNWDWKGVIIQRRNTSLPSFFFHQSGDCSYILRTVLEIVVPKKLIVLSKKLNKMFLMIGIWIK